MTQVTSINIAMCINREYLLPLAVAVRSLMEHLQPGVQVQLYVLSASLKQPDKAWLAEAWQGFPLTVTHVVPTDMSWANNVACGGYIHDASTYFRLLLGELLPKSVERVLYLDSDILVTQDITPLWHEDLQGCVLGAVQQSTVQVLKAAYGAGQCRAMGVDPDAPYLNSGMLLIDLVEWRRQGVGVGALALAVQYKHLFHYHDQDALNVALAGTWKRLHPKWNAQYALWIVPDSTSPHEEGAAAQARDMPVILHYTYRLKPWHTRSDHPLTALWRATEDALPEKCPSWPVRLKMSDFEYYYYNADMRLWFSRALYRSGHLGMPAVMVFVEYALRHPVASYAAFLCTLGRFFRRFRK